MLTPCLGSAIHPMNHTLVRKPNTRCSECANAIRKPIDKHKRLVRPYTHAMRKRRADVVKQHVELNGYVCPGWEREPHPSRDLTADHVEPFHRTHDENSSLQVLCRQCNSRKSTK